MKIIIEHHDHKITYEVDYEDVSMDEMLEILNRMLKADGYPFDGHLDIVDNELNLNE